MNINLNFGKILEQFKTIEILKPISFGVYGLAPLRQFPDALSSQKNPSPPPVSPDCGGAARHARTESGNERPPRSRRRPSKFSPSAMLRKAEDKSEWWVVDGEMNEIGESVPLRERFVIPRDNIPNKRRKQLREQFMRRTRLVLKESEHEPWCKRYMELYNELRENWERLYWDDGYSKKLAEDHANYDSPDDDEEDFNPYRNRQPQADQIKLQDQFVGRNKESDTWEKASQIRDEFEYDRERRMREKAFAPMNATDDSDMNRTVSSNEPFDIRRYISESDEE